MSQQNQKRVMVQLHGIKYDELKIDHIKIELSGEMTDVSLPHRFGFAKWAVTKVAPMYKVLLNQLFGIGFDDEPKEVEEYCANCNCVLREDEGACCDKCNSLATVPEAEPIMDEPEPEFDHDAECGCLICKSAQPGYYIWLGSTCVAGPFSSRREAQESLLPEKRTEWAWGFKGGIDAFLKIPYGDFHIQFHADRP